MTERRPNFFLVGAPRCGTTSLYGSLNQHPDIFMPHVKEPVFFGSDLQKRPRPFDERGYLDLFRGARTERRLGEASVWYLYSKTAPREIKEFSTDARIIIMLRNPVDMMYSLHSLMVFTGNEDIADFEDALAAEDARRRGDRLPRFVRRREALLYRTCARYSRHVKRYLDTFGSEAVRVIVYEEFRPDPVAAYRDTLSFLGVDPTFTPRLSLINANKAVRSPALQAVITSPEFFRLTRRLPRGLVRPARQALKKLNTREVPRPPLDEGLRQRLAEELSDDVASLEVVLRRDLSIWSDAASSGRGG